jgi:hypothetical protein
MNISCTSIVTIVVLLTTDDLRAVTAINSSMMHGQYSMAIVHKPRIVLNENPTFPALSMISIYNCKA